MSLRQTTPRILVVYFSRTGTTRSVAAALSKILVCDLEEIFESKSRLGFFGYWRSIFEARGQQSSQILPIRKNPSAYDLVIIGTPVWAWSLSSPVRAYLMQNAGRLADVAFFCTMGAAGGPSTFAQMAAIVHKTPRATFLHSEADSADLSQPLARFVDELHLPAPLVTDAA
jgi:menaquinone-dependent protoporphyrinogen IX oxidase